MRLAAFAPKAFYLEQQSAAMSVAVFSMTPIGEILYVQWALQAGKDDVRNHRVS
jgi:hypothetical protein